MTKGRRGACEAATHRRPGRGAQRGLAGEGNVTRPSVEFKRSLIREARRSGDAATGR